MGARESKGTAPAVPGPRHANERLDSAVEFARLVPVVIVKGKHPGGYLGAGWQHQATRDEHVLRDWWAHWPEGNVGVVPSGELAPVDVDAPAAFERLQRETAEAPPTPRFYTGGAHPPGRERLLFAHPGERALAGIVDTMIAPGVQLRVPLPGRGALMSLVPPSAHPDTGVRQEWRIGLDEVPLAPLPEAWLARVPRAKRGRPKSEWAALFARTFTAGCGETHPSFVAMAGRLVPAVGARATFELLRCWNARHCRPPKDEREIAAAIRWVARKEARR
jgi:hypothetical protein